MYKDRLLVSIILLLASLSALAQEHIEFKGFPVDGYISDFVAKLSDEGFVYQHHSQDLTYLKGTLAGKDCDLIVRSSAKTNTVYSVVVNFTATRSWTEVNETYSVIKSGLIAKYGKPSYVKEKFKGSYKAGDGSELLAFRYNRANWQSEFKIPQGIVEIAIVDRKLIVDALQLVLKYEDSANSKMALNEVAADL